MGVVLTAALTDCEARKGARAGGLLLNNARLLPVPLADARKVVCPEDGSEQGCLVEDLGSGRGVQPVWCVVGVCGAQC